jgi:hypothetical protein
MHSDLKGDFWAIAEASAASIQPMLEAIVEADN